MSNCPLMSQSQLNKAPWNSKSPTPQKVEVTISLTLSKTVEIEVSDYEENEVWDEEGKGINYDFSECDLKEAVKEQVTLPNEAYSKLHHAVYLTGDHDAQHNIEDLKDWSVDDFEVVLE